MIKPHWKIRFLSLLFFDENAEKIMKYRWFKGRIISQNDSKFVFSSQGSFNDGRIDYEVENDLVG